MKMIRYTDILFVGFWNKGFGKLIKGNKLSFLSLALFIVASMFCSCSDQDSQIPSSIPLTVTAEINDNDETRADGTSWQSNDAIGISCSRYNNVRYIYDSGKFTSAKVIYLKGSREETFHAYYPYKSDDNIKDGIINIKTKDDSNSQSNWKDFDFMYAETTASVNNPTANFTFTHKMSKLSFTLLVETKDGFEYEDIKNINIVKLSNLKLEGTFHTQTGIATPKSTATTEELQISRTDLVETPNTSVNIKFDNIILFPQEATSTLSFSLAGENFSCELPLDLDAGQSYAYTITVKKTGLEVKSDSSIYWSSSSTGTFKGTATDLTNGHDAVQMLSNLWVATCNIGAKSPEDPGLYFWWGDVIGHTPGDGFEFSSYNDQIGTYYQIDLTNKQSYLQSLYDKGYTKDAKKGILKSDYDAAVKNWGWKWRIPTYSELSDLAKSCTWTWQDSPMGYIVKSHVNDDTIFLPATGKIGEGADNTTEIVWESTGLYWSNQFASTNVCGKADILKLSKPSISTNPIYPHYVHISNEGIKYGLAIRPVFSN